MEVAVFDIEADGLLDTVSRVHCLAVNDKVYHDAERLRPRHGSLSQGLLVLGSANLLVAHNGLAYDLPVLLRLFDFRVRAYGVFDTQVAARLRHPDVAVQDSLRSGFPSELTGHHSLEAWGHRLGIPKDEYDGGWEEINEDMIRYCLQDVKVTTALYEALK